MSANLLVLGLDLMHVLGLAVDYERLYNLHEVQSDRKQVHAQVVYVDIEAITLVRSEAVGSSVIQELIRFAISLQVDHEDVQSSENLQRSVKDSFTVLEALNQVVDGLNSIKVKTVLINYDSRIVVDSF